MSSRLVHTATLRPTVYVPVYTASASSGHRAFCVKSSMDDDLALIDKSKQKHYTPFENAVKAFYQMPSLQTRLGESVWLWPESRLNKEVSDGK